jgi:hypothetical protein
MIHHLPISFGAINDHQDVVAQHHRFESRRVDGQVWDFAHLEAFALKVSMTLPPSVNVMIDVVVLFSNHCFTRAKHPQETLAQDWLFEDDRETRVLDQERYDLSKQHLLRIVKQLPTRRIFVADPNRPNYVTIEMPHSAGQQPQHYAVFFEVERDKRRQKRVLLRIQSAYLLEQKSKRLEQAEKINFSVLLRRAYLKG